jgi:pimeloyl-ACP methyl ester carboxylesterase
VPTRQQESAVFETKDLISSTVVYSGHQESRHLSRQLWEGSLLVAWCKIEKGCVERKFTKRRREMMTRRTILTAVVVHSLLCVSFGTAFVVDPPLTFARVYRPMLMATPPPQSTTLKSVANDVTSSDPVVHVQRVYETYRWKYSSGQEEEDNDDTKDTYYNINYRVEGPEDGPPILLVHGFGANVNHFRFQFPELVQAGYRVHAVDLLGFGASDKPATAKYSMELFCQLLKDFLLAMPTQKPWTIAGNSIGGLCCLLLAQTIPQRIQGIVLFNCSGGMNGFRYEEVPWYLRPILFLVQNLVIQGPIGPLFFANFRTRANVESILRTQGVYGVNAQTAVDNELLEILLRPADDEGACDVFLNVFGGPVGPTPESILPSIQCPILALWGSADPWTPVEKGLHPATGLAQYYNLNNSNNKKEEDFFVLSVLPGVGHCPHDEVPEMVNSKMIAWMDQMRGRYQPAS